MLGSRRTKDFQAISGCMLLQNCGILIGKNPYAVREIVLEGKVPARSLPWYLCAVLKKWLI